MKTQKSNIDKILWYTVFLLTLAVIAGLLAQPAKGQAPFVGNSYEHLLRELGPPSFSQQLPGDIMLISYNENDFFYLDTQTETIILQRFYTSKFIARRYLKRLSRNYNLSEGWFYITDTNLDVNVSTSNGDHIIQIKQPNNPTARNLALDIQTKPKPKPTNPRINSY